MSRIYQFTKTTYYEEEKEGEVPGHRQPAALYKSLWQAFRHLIDPNPGYPS